MKSFSLEEIGFYDYQFPNVKPYGAYGFVCSGGDLSVGCLLQAYSHGIFPWFGEDEPYQWWSPDPRYVLIPENVHVSESMRKIMRRNIFEVRVDDDFKEVMTMCSKTHKSDGTWITDEMINAYTTLFELGFAHCISIFQDNRRVGGLYGVSLGRIFCGESMFGTVSNASKTAFIVMARMLGEQHYSVIDCQFHTNHLESLGGTSIPREQYLAFLDKDMAVEPNFNWQSWLAGRTTKDFV